MFLRAVVVFVVILSLVEYVLEDSVVVLLLVCLVFLRTSSHSSARSKWSLTPWRDTNSCSSWRRNYPPWTTYTKLIRTKWKGACRKCG